MLPTVHPARRAVAGVLGALATATIVAAPSASADPPNCTAADLAGVAAGVSAATSAYLFTHPDANAFMTFARSSFTRSVSHSSRYERMNTDSGI
jgi:hypothetical protein